MNQIAIRATLLAVVGAAWSAHGQIPYPAFKVNPPNAGNISYRETAIAVSATNPNELVAAAIYEIPSPFTRYIAYGVSTNAGITFSAGNMAPPGPCLGTTTLGDPMTAFSPTTGELWVGGLAYNAPTGDSLQRAKRPVH